MTQIPLVAVTGAFDDLGSPALRFLQEAARLGGLVVLLWSDEQVSAVLGKPPKFPLAERAYFLQALRYVKQAVPVAASVGGDSLPKVPGFSPTHWVFGQAEDNAAKRAFCEKEGLRWHSVAEADLQGFPGAARSVAHGETPRRKVVATGTFDWFHSGHVRFFEEAAALGDLSVVVGHDANIRLLKGEGHPLFPQAERQYMVQSIRFVTEALISTGDGWLDAAPEIERLHPDIYAVNEDGDRGGKREYCQQHGIEYRVLQRTPAPGLPRRSSTDLRGF